VAAAMLILLGLYELDRKYAFSYSVHVSCSDYSMVLNDRRFPNGSYPHPITSKPHIYGCAPAVCFPDRLCHSQTWIICLMRFSRHCSSVDLGRRLSIIVHPFHSRYIRVSHSLQGLSEALAKASPQQLHTAHLTCIPF
jgi:hypothetical protein